MGVEDTGMPGQYQLLTVDNTTYLMPVGESDVRRAVGIINSGDALILERFNQTGVISADLFRGPIQIYGPNGDDTSPANVIGALNFMDIAAMRDGMKSSLGDLVVLVMMLTLEVAKDSRRTMGENTIMKREIAAKQIIFVYKESVHAAEERREAAKREATFALVGACVSCAASIVSIGLSIGALKASITAVKGGSSSAAGEVDAKSSAVQVKELETKAQFYNQMAHSLGQIGGSLESIIKNSGSFESAEMRFRADIAQANVEAIRSYLQMLNAEMGTSDSAYRDASQQISQALDLARQALNALQALRDTTIRNI